jgi:prepilin-type processing-associated H-X9-DG protein
MEEQALHDSFNLTVKINDPAATGVNRIARGSIISVLLCPSDSENNRVLFGQAGRGTSLGDNWARTNYAGNAGRADFWATEDPNKKRYMKGPDSFGWQDPCKRGVMGPNVSVKPGRIADGTSKTIMLGEIRTGLSTGDSHGVWGLGHAGASLLAGYGAGGDDNGPNACNATHKEDDVISDMCTSAQAFATCMSCDPGYFSQATIRSNHTGGAYVAMCDGSVQFINDDIETTGSTIGSPCCTAWDYMIASADEGRTGAYNSTPAGPCY